ncbi:isoprenoid biosynthesis glyoxalase ElbB [Bacteroidales bacterium OttesenSCG-928-C19]|nr:isoprenoid biosynthesis glyoxalase ElbB [Bacteroidales bacterium OttesenSCG-928-C19]
MKKFAIILAGNGVYDGSEIHEAVMTMLAIDKLGAEYIIFAPNKKQHHVINHLTGEEMNESRNVLTEAARIARGNIHDLSEFTPNDFDALVIPGGFGAAKNLSDYAFKGADITVDHDVEDAILGMHKLKRPIGALCIAPVILAKALKNATVTIGSDEGTAKDIETVGGKHQTAIKNEVVVDKTNLLFTTPCYMLDASINDVAISAENLVKEMLKVM